MEVSSDSKCRTSNEPRGAAHEQLLSFFLTAKNRLEYLTRNDWALILDRAKQRTVKKGEMLTRQGKRQGCRHRPGREWERACAAARCPGMKKLNRELRQWERIYNTDPPSSA
jgi:hypothetical protein